MSAAREMLCDTARAVFAEAVTTGIAPVADAGFELLLVPEAEGGFGGDWGDVNAVLQIAGVMVPDLRVAELIASDALQPAATVSLMAGATSMRCCRLRGCSSRICRLPHCSCTVGVKGCMLRPR